MNINTYDVLLANNIIHLRINKGFFAKVKSSLINKYGSLSRYNKEQLLESKAYARQIFNINKYIKPSHILKMVKDAAISLEELFKNITGFRSKGSRNCIDRKIQPFLNVDKAFVEGYGLYLAEGDNGSNGSTVPKKLRLVNSDLNVIKSFMKWIDRYFPDNPYYVVYVLPNRLPRDEKHIEEVKRFLEINDIKITNWDAKKKSKICYRVCLDSSVIVHLFLAIEESVKSYVQNDDNLMRAYIRGLMIGEGTVHHKGNFHYVRIEMKNKKEILFLASLFEKLGFKFTCKERGTRKDMWYIYMGGRENLTKYYQTIGFGVQEKRQKILEDIVYWYKEKDTKLQVPNLTSTRISR